MNRRDFLAATALLCLAPGVGLQAAEAGHGFQQNGDPITTKQFQPPYMDPLEPCPRQWFHLDFIPVNGETPTAVVNLQATAPDDAWVLQDPRKETPPSLSPTPEANLGAPRPPGWGIPAPLLTDNTQRAVLSPDNKRVAWRMRDGSVWLSEGVAGAKKQVLKTSSSASMSWSPDASTLAVGAVLVRVPSGTVVRIPVTIDDTLVHWLSPTRAVLVDPHGTVSYTMEGNEVKPFSRGFIPRVSPDRSRVLVAVGPSYDQFATARPGPLSRARIALLNTEGKVVSTVAKGYQAEWLDARRVAVLSLAARGDAWTPVMTVYRV